MKIFNFSGKKDVNSSETKTSEQIVLQELEKTIRNDKLQTKKQITAAVKNFLTSRLNAPLVTDDQKQTLLNVLKDKNLNVVKGTQDRFYVSDFRNQLIEKLNQALNNKPTIESIAGATLNVKKKLAGPELITGQAAVIEKESNSDVAAIDKDLSNIKQKIAALSGEEQKNLQGDFIQLQQAAEEVKNKQGYFSRAMSFVKNIVGSKDGAKNQSESADVSAENIPENIVAENKEWSDSQKPVPAASIAENRGGENLITPPEEKIVVEPIVKEQPQDPELAKKQRIEALKEIVGKLEGKTIIVDRKPKDEGAVEPPSTVLAKETNSEIPVESTMPTAPAPETILPSDDSKRKGLIKPEKKLTVEAQNIRERLNKLGIFEGKQIIYKGKEYDVINISVLDLTLFDSKKHKQKRYVNIDEVLYLLNNKSIIIPGKEKLADEQDKPITPDVKRSTRPADNYATRGHRFIVDEKEVLDKIAVDLGKDDARIYDTVVALENLNSNRAWEIRYDILEKGADKAAIVQGITGDDNRAWKMRQECLDEGININSVAMSLAGEDSDQAWNMRQDFLEKGADAWTILSGLAGLDSEKAWEMREKLYQAGASKDDLAISLAGLDSEKAWEMREKLYQEGADREYIAQGLAGLDSDKAKTRFNELLEECENPEHAAKSELGKYLLWRANSKTFDKSPADGSVTDTVKPDKQGENIASGSEQSEEKISSQKIKPTENQKAFNTLKINNTEEESVGQFNFKDLLSLDKVLLNQVLEKITDEDLMLVLNGLTSQQRKKILKQLPEEKKPTPGDIAGYKSNSVNILKAKQNLFQILSQLKQGLKTEPPAEDVKKIHSIPEPAKGEISPEKINLPPEALGEKISADTLKSVDNPVKISEFEITPEDKAFNKKIEGNPLFAKINPKNWFIRGRKTELPEPEETPSATLSEQEKTPLEESLEIITAAILEKAKKGFTAGEIAKELGLKKSRVNKEMAGLQERELSDKEREEINKDIAKGLTAATLAAVYLLNKERVKKIIEDRLIPPSETVTPELSAVILEKAKKSEKIINIAQELKLSEEAVLNAINELKKRDLKTQEVEEILKMADNGSPVDAIATYFVLGRDRVERIINERQIPSAKLPAAETVDETPGMPEKSISAWKKWWAMPNNQREQIAGQINKQLYKTAASVLGVKLFTDLVAGALFKKGDLYDWLDAKRTPKNIQALVKDIFELQEDINNITDEKERENAEIILTKKHSRLFKIIHESGSLNAEQKDEIFDKINEEFTCQEIFSPHRETAKKISDLRKNQKVEVRDDQGEIIDDAEAEIISPDITEQKNKLIDEIKQRTNLNEIQKEELVAQVDALINDYETTSERLKRERDDKITNLTKTYILSKVSGYQILKDAGNLLATASGLIAVRGAVYAGASALERGQKANREYAQKKQAASAESAEQSKLGFILKDVTINSFYETVEGLTLGKAGRKDKKGKNKVGEKKTGLEKGIDFVRSFGSVARAFGIGGTALRALAENNGAFGSVDFDKLCQAVTGGDWQGAAGNVGENLLNNVKRSYNTYFHPIDTAEKSVHGLTELYKQQVHERFFGEEQKDLSAEIQTIPAGTGKKPARIITPEEDAELHKLKNNQASSQGVQKAVIDDKMVKTSDQPLLNPEPINPEPSQILASLKGNAHFEPFITEHNIQESDIKGAPVKWTTAAPKPGTISGILNKAMGPEATVTVINPDGKIIENFDADLVHPNDTVIEKNGQIYVFKSSGVNVKEGTNYVPGKGLVEEQAALQRDNQKNPLFAFNQTKVDASSIMRGPNPADATGDGGLDRLITVKQSADYRHLAELAKNKGDSLVVEAVSGSSENYPLYKAKILVDGQENYFLELDKNTRADNLQKDLAALQSGYDKFNDFTGRFKDNSLGRTELLNIYHHPVTQALIVENNITAHDFEAAYRYVEPLGGKLNYPAQVELAKSFITNGADKIKLATFLPPDIIATNAGTEKVSGQSIIKEGIILTYIKGGQVRRLENVKIVFNTNNPDKGFVMEQSGKALYSSALTDKGLDGISQSADDIFHK